MCLCEPDDLIKFYPHLWYLSLITDEECPPGQFNKALPGQAVECVDCFCFGVTNECEPIHVKVNEVGYCFFHLK